MSQSGYGGLPRSVPHTWFPFGYPCWFHYRVAQCPRNPSATPPRTGRSLDGESRIGHFGLKPRWSLVTIGWSSKLLRIVAAVNVRPAHQPKGHKARPPAM